MKTSLFIYHPKSMASSTRPSPSSSRRSRPTDDNDDNWMDNVPLFLSQTYCWEFCCVGSICCCLGIFIFVLCGTFLVGGLAYENRNPPGPPGPPGPVIPPGSPTPVPTPSQPPAIMTQTPNQTGAPPITAPPPPPSVELPTFAPIPPPWNTEAVPPSLGPPYPKCNTSADCPAFNFSTVRGCSNGYCTIVSCVAGRGNCDGDIWNGCESPLLFDPFNCNGCGNICPYSHSIPVCTNGLCDATNITCVPNWGNCNGYASDFCETNLADSAFDCGTCGTRCTPDAPHVQSVYCRNSECVIYSCSDGWADCDLLYSTGCETPITNNNLHCGACNIQCNLATSCCRTNELGTKCAMSAGQTITVPSHQVCIGQPLTLDTCTQDPTLVDAECCTDVDCEGNVSGEHCGGVLGIHPETYGHCTIAPTP